MPKSYFSQYVSPNIVIVPTLTFLPPCKENKADPDTNSISCCEQSSDINSKTSTSSSISDQNTINEADCSIAGCSTSDSDYLHKQAISQTVEQEKQMNQNNKELPSNKYKSRNNLVDFTGFNIHKRDSSLTKQKDSERTHFEKKPDLIKIVDKKENEEYLGSDTRTKNIKSYRESSKSEVVLNSSCKGNIKDIARSVSTQDKANMEDKMKKYFKQLWKRNIDKLKDKSEQNADLKSLGTKEDLKRKPSQNKNGKSKSEEGAKRTTLKSTKNKTIGTSSPKYSTRPKIESKTSLQSNRDRKGYLSPNSIIRYKNFQNFLHNENQDDVKYKTANHNKKENLHSGSKLLKSHITNMYTEPKNLSVKSDKFSDKNIDNKNTMKIVRSVVKQVNKNISNNTQSKCDLRSRLSRKRTRSECFTHSQQTLENKMNREDLIITVKQDVKPDPKILAKLPTKCKPKTKKCKKIKLVINIECPTSDSENSEIDNECCTSPQDLSFLDDFDVDEIVDLLNTNHSQPESSPISSDMSHPINNTFENDQTVKSNQEPKSKGRLFKTKNIKTNKLNKAINIDIEKLAGDKSHGRDEEEIRTDSFLLVKQKFCGGEANVKKPNDKPKIDSVTAVKKSLEIINGITKADNTEANKKPKNISQNPECRIQKHPLITKKILNMKVAKPIKPSHTNIIKAADPIEASLETMFNNIEQNTSITKTEDTIEASLDDMFNNIKKDTAINSDTKVINACQYIKQEEIMSVDQLKMTNKTDTYIKTEPENSQNVDTEILSDSKQSIEQKVTPIIIRQSIEQKVTPIIISKQNNSNQNINQSTEYLQTRENKSSKDFSHTKQPNNDQIHIELYKSDKRIEKRKQTSTNNLEVTKHTKTDKEVNITLTRPYKSKENASDSKKPKDINKKSIEKSISSLVSKDQQIKSNTSLQSSDKNIKQKHSLNTEQCQKKCSLQQNAKLSCITENNIAESEVVNQIEFRALSFNDHTKKVEQKEYNESVINNKATNKNAEKKINVKTNINPKNLKEAEHLKTSNSTGRSSVAASNNNTMEKKVSSSNKSDINIKENEKLPQKITDVSNIKTHLKKSNASTKTITENLRICDTRNSCHEAMIKKDEKTKLNISKKKMKTNVNILQQTDNTSEKTLETVNNTTSNKNATTKKSSEKSVVPNQSDTNITEKENPTQNLTEVSKNENDIKEKSYTKTGIKQSTESNKPISENIKGDSRSQCLEAMTKKAEKTKSNKEIGNNVNNLQQTDCTSQKSLRTVNDSSSNKNAKSSEKSVATIKSMSTVDIKKVSVATEKGSIKTGTKSSTEEKREKSPEKANNDSNTRTPDDDDRSKAKDSKIKSTEKINNMDLLDEKIDTNTKTKQKQVDSDDKIISNGVEKKRDTKVVKAQNKVLSEIDLFVKNMEERMLIYIDKQYTVTSLVHTGHFSTIYKCKDDKGDSYAVKVMNSKPLKNKGLCMERMFLQLHKYRSIRHSPILGLINGFGVQGLWCLLTEYYPKNLEEALKENKRSFHIELVQVLARQLIDAVNMLTDNNIIHSDIKPPHILLNSTNERLKLCGFDRANHSEMMRITPSTGTPSYRAPEVILGFSEDFKIDVWSTALVIYEMATNIKLFPGQYNNDILYKQICTLGSFDWEMMEYCRYKHKHFRGLSFARRVGHKGENIVLVHAFHRNKRLRKQLYNSAHSMISEAVESKIEDLHTLLEQMLVLDPRHRLPIQFASASEFLQDVFT